MKVTGSCLTLLALLFVACGEAGDPGVAGPAIAPSGIAAAQEEPEAAPSLTDVARYLAPPGTKGVERATQVIGPDGGSLRLRDFEVVVPAGAVAKDTKFEIKILPEQARDQHAWAQFSPHNTQFAVPVILRVPYSSTESAGGEAHVLWWNRGAWTSLETTITADGRLETVTDHFSTYATERKRGITVIGG